ncbi:hypothetical protein HYU19_02015 [Candidatus Woesearchaeota archaeon]|nr:hypothetical protein [Candidatus Woesearchaeota archaeon]
MILCKRCGGKVPSYNKLRKWCVDCRHDLTNERARLRNKQKTLARREERQKQMV